MAVRLSTSAQLSDQAGRLFGAPIFCVLTTISKDGSPHASMMWVRRDGDDLLMVTVRDRQKWRDIARDPRVTLLAHDPENPYHYVEVRGTAAMTEDGGRELMHELCLAYTGEPWTVDPSQVRVVVRVTPTKIVEAKVPTTATPSASGQLRLQ